MGEEIVPVVSIIHRILKEYNVMRKAKNKPTIPLSSVSLCTELLKNKLRISYQEALIIADEIAVREREGR